MEDEYEIYLRPLRMEDAMVSWRWRNNPEVWKNTGSAPDRHVTVEMEREWLRKALSDGTTKRYAICLKKGDRYVGNVYLEEVDRDSAIEQIFIGEVNLWGHGIGTRARSAVYEIAKGQYGKRRIETHIRVRNVASLKSVLKLGFVEFSRDAEWVKLHKWL